MTESVTGAPTGGWRTATVREVAHPSPHAVVVRLEVPDRVEHLAGQHYVVRLTAEDGYVAQRSYSVASAPSDPLLEFYVERLDDGEVSTYIADVVEVGDPLEVRGPIGGWFVWAGDSVAVGVGGGSGVVPLVAMLRHAVHRHRTDLLHLAVAARSRAELPYADELIGAGAALAFSRSITPAGRPAGRLAEAEIAALVDPAATYFVCGSSGFAETVSSALVIAGVEPAVVRVERFGATG